MEMVTDVVVIGAGPGGFSAAIFAARQGARVILCEQLKIIGAKILVSGGTKCNITNNASMDDFIGGFSSGDTFLRPALNQFFSKELLSFLHDLSLETGSYDGFHVFPKSNKAKEVVEVLKRECDRLGVEIVTQQRIDELVINDGEIAGVIGPDLNIAATKVVLATGGKSYSKCGGTGGGYPLAKQAGHKLTKLLPAMVAVQVEQTWPGECSGVTIENASFFLNHRRYDWNVKRGSIMFTHKGVTGLRLLDISGDSADILQQNKTVPLSMNFCADISAEDWLEKFIDWKKKSPKNRIHKLLQKYIPQRLVNILCTEAGNLIGVKADKISDEQRDMLITLLTAYQFDITGTEKFDRAMVTRGGIKLKDIDAETMGSKLTKGLYFAGEVLNIDGPCGGYNIQWGFSSGRLAGLSATQTLGL